MPHVVKAWKRKSPTLQRTRKVRVGLAENLMPEKLFKEHMHNKKSDPTKKLEGIRLKF